MDYHSFINPSEVAAIFDEDPHKTLFTVHHAKKSEISPESRDLSHLKFFDAGIHAMVCAEVGGTAKTNSHEIRKGRMASRTPRTISGGSFDSWTVKPKMYSLFYFRDSFSDLSIPTHIEIEIQSELEISGSPGCILACLVDSIDLKLIYRPRNEKIGAAIRQRVSEFWKDFEAGVEPSAHYVKDLSMLRALNGEAEEDKNINLSSDETVNAQLSNYKQWSQEKKKLEGLMESAKALVLQKAGTSSHIEALDYTVHCGRVKDTKPKTIEVTKEMVGEKIQVNKGRKGHRAFRLTAINK